MVSGSEFGERRATFPRPSGRGPIDPDSPGPLPEDAARAGSAARSQQCVCERSRQARGQLRHPRGSLAPDPPNGPSTVADLLPNKTLPPSTAPFQMRRVLRNPYHAPLAVRMQALPPSFRKRVHAPLVPHPTPNSPANSCTRNPPSNMLRSHPSQSLILVSAPPCLCGENP